MADGGRRILLKIIGWQPMILWANECLEESPGFPRELLKKTNLVRTQPGNRSSERSTEPPDPQWRDEPQSQYGDSSQQRTRLCKRQIDGHSSCNGRPYPHRPPHGGESGGVTTVKIIGGIPFQKPFVRKMHSHVRSRDCSKAEKAFIRKAGKRECGLFAAPSH